MSEPQIEPRLAARRRAVRAIFDMYAKERAPLYVYGEARGTVDAGAKQTTEETEAWMRAMARLAPGEVYAAVFVTEGPNWPGPAYDVYHPPVQERAAVAGDAQYHPLRGGSVFSRPTWGGAPDPTSTSWLYRGPRAFHGHEAPTYDRRGSWPPRRERGVYGRGPLLAGSPRDPVVVGSLYHSVEDRADAVRQMDLDWNALYHLLAQQVGEQRPDAKERGGIHMLTQAERDAFHPDPVKVLWWENIAKPQFATWVKFRMDQLGQDKTVAPTYQAWAERWSTDWSVYEDWLGKLSRLRDWAKQAGFKVDTPAPQKLPTTVVEDVEHFVKKGAETVADKAGDVWTLAKYGAWAVLGIGAVVALTSLGHQLRQGESPARPYVEFARRRRGGGTADVIELPTSAYRELPP